MQDKPFWEQSYSDYEVSTFSKGPTVDVEEFYEMFPRNADVLDVGCGEGRNSISLSKRYAINLYRICRCIPKQEVSM